LLYQGVSSHWNHDGDPTETLQVNQLVERFKKDIVQNKRFLQDKVQQYLKVRSLYFRGRRGMASVPGVQITTRQLAKCE
jgi:hypothetical protein